MITLTLLHPLQSIPVQNWTFENEPVVRIGRSTDNHVILYSAVVSRHHVELRLIGDRWEIVNLGANGTYLDGKRITQVPVEDGVVIRLARSGPNIQIRLGAVAAGEVKHHLTGEETLAQRIKSKLIQSDTISKDTAAQSGKLPVPPHLQVPSRLSDNLAEHSNVYTSNPNEPITSLPSESEPYPSLPMTCSHPRAGENLLFCLDCGQPLRCIQQIGEYHILKTLGQGGMGITYLAWRDGRSVVLKTLNVEWVNHPKALELFEREARILQQLNHPSIPQFIDFFTIANQPYLVMEMIYGQNLERRIATQGPVTQQQAIAWVLEVCNVLQYLHSFDPPILHRDIKPENLICRAITQDAHEIVVVDFGAVKVVARDVGTKIGSSGYTAPEQQEGQALPASDLFSLGPTLVYLLTGQEPSNFYSSREQGFRLYAEYVPGLSNEMISIIRMITQPQAEQRYASAKDLADVLRELL